MMVDNLQLEPLSVQFCGELMPQADIDMCSIIDISNPYLTLNPPRLPVPVHAVKYNMAFVDESEVWWPAEVQ